jgi:hypothetical protein
MGRSDKNITLEDITIAFRNFAGKEDAYNREGDRNFAVFLDLDTAQKMLGDGWNVKYLKKYDDGDDQPPQAFIQVAVSYKNRPPKIGMVTSKGMTYLGEKEVEMLDWVDIEQADVTLNPYQWSVNGKSGVKAYVQSLFVKIEEDYLQLKWTSYVDDQKQISNGRRELESAPDYIDGEYELT